MYSIEDVSNDIYRSVINKSMTYNHDSIVVVGDNSTGKTKLIKTLLDKVKKESSNDFYFIDSLNRMVYGSEGKNQESVTRYSDFSPLEIIKERSSIAYLSKEDIFPKANKGSLVTYSELIGNVNHYEEIFNKFFACKLNMGSTLCEDSIISGNNILNVNGKNFDSLPSSEAARIRLIMECEYAKCCGCKMVIIDEFDNSLDPDNQVKLASQLLENYPELRFIFVIHNFALLVQLSGMDAVIYNNSDTSPIDMNIVDCDDVTAIGEVNRIRTKYIGQKDSEEVFLSSCVFEIIKKGNLSKEHDDILIEIDRNNLNAKKRILYDYIVERQNESYIKNKV